jgi:nucleotide-binding universal stress UspA family protein
MKRILIAADEGPTAEKIALVAFELARRLDAEIALVGVVDSSHLATDGGITPHEMAEIMKNDLRKSQQILIERIFKDYKVWAFIEEGKPFEKILKVADEWQADLIVSGTHGRKGLEHLLLGSVAEKLVRHSTKPILIVPTK